jgi:hypothetical protein
VLRREVRAGEKNQNHTYLTHLKERESKNPYYY